MNSFRFSLLSTALHQKSIYEIGQRYSTAALENDFFKYLTGPCKVRAGFRMLLCVSGGSDSISLLHLTVAVCQRLQPPLQVEVIHFNHNLRAESSEEAEFVRSIAAVYGIPFHLREWAEPPLQKAVHETSRRWRRQQCLQLLKADEHEGRSEVNETGSVSDSLDAVICTAHQREDQTETLLLKLLRGAHLSKLQMMKPRDGHFAKPLLSFSKSQLVAYLSEHRHEWCEDLSNLERKYQRNRVRLDLVPLMEELAGGRNALYRRCAAMSEQSQLLDNWINAEVRSVLLYSAHLIDRNNILPWCVMKADSGVELWNKDPKVLLLHTVDNNKERYFQSLPLLVQGELIRNFIAVGSGVTPDYPMVCRVLNLVGTQIERSLQGDIASFSKSALLNKRVSISHDLEIKRLEWALVIEKRSSRRNVEVGEMRCCGSVFTCVLSMFNRPRTVMSIDLI